MSDTIRLSKEKFHTGVIEGFYGEPWTFEQRVILFKRLARMKMNSYLYAPKDDSKHRFNWRVAYTQQELSILKSLIDSCLEFNIDFIFALSPGLDIEYSSEKELELLLFKLNQVKSIGCKSFALLFDDIENSLCPNDLTLYKNPATAQSLLTNKVYNSLDRPELFLFCPTEYCSTRSYPTVKDSPYLNTIGNTLDENILLFWTGAAVISERISFEDLIEISTVVKRRIVIWDNLHANDYDSKRIFLGPYYGRSCEIKDADCLAGVMSNPNCEFESNYIPLDTLSQWIQCPRVDIQREMADLSSSVDGGVPNSGYCPRGSLEKSILNWHHVINDHEEFSSENKPSPMETNSDEENQKVCENPKEFLSNDQIAMLVDFNYLPFCEGPLAEEFIKLAYTVKYKAFDRLLKSEYVVQTSKSVHLEDSVDLETFHNWVRRIVKLKHNLLSVRNRSLIAELLPYLVYLENGALITLFYMKWLYSVQLSSHIVEAIKSHQHVPQIGPNQAILSRSHSPWTYRSSTTANLYRVLPMGSYYDLYNLLDNIYQNLFPPVHKYLMDTSLKPNSTINMTKFIPLTSSNYNIRSIAKTDHQQIYSLYLKKVVELNSIDPEDVFLIENELVISKLLGDQKFLAHFELSPETCFLIECDRHDESGSCIIGATVSSIKPTLHELFWKGYRQQNIAEKEFSVLLQAIRENMIQSTPLKSLISDCLDWINLDPDESELINQEYGSEFARMNLIIENNIHEIYLIRLIIITFAALKTCHYTRAYVELDYRDDKSVERLRSIGFQRESSQKKPILMTRQI